MIRLTHQERYSENLIGTVWMPMTPTQQAHCLSQLHMTLVVVPTSNFDGLECGGILVEFHPLFLHHEPRV